MTLKVALLKILDISQSQYLKANYNHQKYDFESRPTKILDILHKT